MRAWKIACLLVVSMVLTGSTGYVQTPATGRVMREKLTHSQKVLEAIMTSNYAELDTETRALARLTESPEWSVLHSPEYARHSAAFLRETEALLDAAKGRDLDEAMLHYMSLTLTCFQCHRYLKNSRIATTVR